MPWIERKNSYQGLPSADRTKAKAKIEDSRQDLVEQMEMAHDNLWGVFPLLRFTIFQKENWVSPSSFRLGQVSPVLDQGVGQTDGRPAGRHDLRIVEPFLGHPQVL
jgi:hypothetical protein